METLKEFDKEFTKQAVENYLGDYRLYKYHSSEERKTNITPSYDERLHGPTFETGDQTANAAIYNVDSASSRERFCRRVENAVKSLPSKEKELIEKRYLTSESDYLTDMSVYQFELEDRISLPTYIKIRNRAFRKLAYYLNIQVYKEDE